MTYEIWETAAGNIVGAYATMDRALAVVRQSVAAYGKEYVESWLLAFEDDNGDGDVIAEGPALAALALEPRAPKRRHALSA